MAINVPDMSVLPEADVIARGSHLRADTTVLARTFVPGPDFEETYAKARRVLSLFIKDLAHRTAHALGFGWFPTVTAPSTFDALVEEQARSARFRGPLPVSSEFCDTVMFTRPERNHEFRFCHDLEHIRTGLSFTEIDEVELSHHHLKLAARAGLSTKSLEYQMYATDLLGQNKLIAAVKDFAINQNEFVRGCLLNGFYPGLVIEGERRSVLRSS